MFIKKKAHTNSFIQDLHGDTQHSGGSAVNSGQFDACSFLFLYKKKCILHLCVSDVFEIDILYSYLYYIVLFCVIYILKFTVNA